MERVGLIFPHQLFDPHPAAEGVKRVVFVEEPLLFSQYAFHRQKLLLHHASVYEYATTLRRRGIVVVHLTPTERDTAGELRAMGIHGVQYVDPCDDWISTRLTSGLAREGIAAATLDDPHFLTPPSEIERFSTGRKRFFFTDFYIAQRKRLGILVESDGSPVGGQWSFDPDNRKRLPRGIHVPAVSRPSERDAVRRSRAWLGEHYPAAPGSDTPFLYPTDHVTAARWLDTFVMERLPLFGDYEDAISREHDVVFHSVLTPMLNIGLLSPRQVVDAALARASDVPINSLEGFVRQIIGWREFVRLVYLTGGRAQRSRNFWGYSHKLPISFYDGTTGIEPVDHVIRQVLRTGYCHHIERLMILGNFMLLCEIHPDAVYRWFMELFIDAYDWVMVPNVYGMSQYADGGLMTTKPYISGSNYVLKMSDFPRGPWCETWDTLYWRFVDRHADFFLANPRMAMMVRMKDKLGAKLDEHRTRAELFLDQLHGKR